MLLYKDRLVYIARMPLRFYIAHCPFDEASRRIVNISISSIEKYHPESEILVCYSESHLPVEIHSSNVKVLKSPLQNSSVIGCFKHYLDSKSSEKAVFLHDSMILKGRLDEGTKHSFGFLWYFEGDEYIGLNSIVCQDIKMMLADALKSHTCDYVGCFGLALYSEQTPLKTLWNAIDFPAYVTHPERANALMDLERIVGFYGSALHLLATDKEELSVCGNVFLVPNTFQRWYTNQTLEEIEKMDYKGPIVKAWMNRFLRA